MTTEQYNHFVEVMEKRGYKLYKRKATIQREDFYYYKGFAYDENGNVGYSLLFLVYDFGYIANPEEYEWGVMPFVITESHEWPRIDLEITDNNFDVEKVEEYAHDFYFNFVLTHGL